MFTSTRSNLKVSSSEAIIYGIAKDKGLFTPIKIEKINPSNKYLKYSYQDFAKLIFKSFFFDFSSKEINEIVNKAYNKKNFKKCFYQTKIINDIAFLELYHGNTYAFKDMALSALPYFMDIAKKKLKLKKKIKIVVATSGDTGGAVLNAFRDYKDIEVIVLYPNKGVSNTQENQMKSLQTSHSYAFALNGNFDVCQKTVKELLNNQKNKNVLLTSANSINIARLIPQVVYYFASYYDELYKILLPEPDFANLKGDLDHKLDDMDFQNSKLYKDVFKIGSRYSITFSYKGMDASCVDCAAQSKGEKALQTLFYGKYLITPNKYKGEGLYIYFNGNERAIPPNNLSGLTPLESCKAYSIYGDKNTLKFLSKPIKDMLARIKTNDLLVDLAISIQPGKTYFGVGYEDIVVNIPYEFQIDEASVKQVKKDMPIFMELALLLNSSKGEEK